MPIFPLYSGPALLEQATSVENLTTAWRRVRANIHTARRGKSAGIDAVTLRDFEADWSTQMVRLAEELRSGTYRPLPARMVTIPKASGGERAIAILSIRDRIAQRAVQQLLQPLFEPLFLDCSYGCRLHVGVPEAVARVARYAEQGLGWVVDTDIASYFDSIDQRILLALLRQRIDEPALLQLISQWLQIGSLQQDETSAVSPEPVGIARMFQLGEGVMRGGGNELPAAPATFTAPVWEQPEGAAWSLTQRPGLDTAGLLTAMSLAQPAFEGLRRLAPYLQRIGTRRLMIGGALAAGAVAIGELALRAHAATHAPRGAPQGGALSPLLANIYLHPFDLAMTSHGMRLVRFMDDLVVMCASREEAEQTLTLTRRQLATLRLNLNEEKTQIVAYSDGLEFLGQSLAPRQRGARLGTGLMSFEEAERALREVSRQTAAQARAKTAQLAQSSRSLPRRVSGRRSNEEREE
jgi:RNA-directed DNA polymerase